jgi:hypothetical protein
MSVSIKFHTRVKKLEFKQRLKRAWRAGENDIRTETEDLGWAILLEGSTEWLFLGCEQPEFSVGQAR